MPNTAIDKKKKESFTYIQHQGSRIQFVAKNENILHNNPLLENLTIKCVNGKYDWKPYDNQYKVLLRRADYKEQNDMHETFSCMC